MSLEDAVYDGFYFETLAEDLNRAEAEDVILDFERGLKEYCSRNGMVPWIRRNVYRAAVTDSLYVHTEPQILSIEGIRSFLDGQMEIDIGYREAGDGEVYLEADLPFNWKDKAKRTEFEELIERVRE